MAPLSCFRQSSLLSFYGKSACCLDPSAAASSSSSSSTAAAAAAAAAVAVDVLDFGSQPHDPFREKQEDEQRRGGGAVPLASSHLLTALPPRGEDSPIQGGDVDLDKDKKGCKNDSRTLRGTRKRTARTRRSPSEQVLKKIRVLKIDCERPSPVSQANVASVLVADTAEHALRSGDYKAALITPKEEERSSPVFADVEASGGALIASPSPLVSARNDAKASAPCVNAANDESESLISPSSPCLTMQGPPKQAVEVHRNGLEHDSQSLPPVIRDEVADQGVQEGGEILDVMPSIQKFKRGLSVHGIQAHPFALLREDNKPVKEELLTDYERKREENIRRNQLFIEKLGISSSLCVNLPPGLSKRSGSGKKRAKNSAAEVHPVPLRRSRRIQHIEPEMAAQKDENAAPPEADQPCACYNDSSIFIYTCREGIFNELKSADIYTGKIIVGFSPAHKMQKPLQDTYLARIYSMSTYQIPHSRHTLLAAGGYQGRIAVFGTSSRGSDDACDSRQDRAELQSMDHDNLDCDELCQEEDPVLLSWKASSGWISAVKFLTLQSQENARLLLSSANDGKLVLWDINKQQQGLQGSSQGLGVGLPPLKITETQGIHSSGIYSMHELAGQIATASKDSTLGIGKVTAHNITKERSISGHHAGAIRGVNFRDGSTLADCGADGLICILDLRMAEGCAIAIDTGDATGLNVVEWCPSQEHLLLSASKDPSLCLYDIRYSVAQGPLHRLSGHVHPKAHRCSHIYRPTFVGGDGQAIATPGQGSNSLSLYSVATGKLISRGELGYDPNMVMWSSAPHHASPSLWVASRHVAQLIPTWQ